MALGWVNEVVPKPPLFEVRPHHCAISVPDLEASVAWYRDMLGFSVELRTFMEHVPMKMAMLRHGDFRIELFEVPGAKPLPPDRRNVDDDVRTHGTKHLALGVQDVRAALAALKQRGVEVAMDVFQIENTCGCFIRDNSGNVIELLQWPGAQ